MLKKFHFIVIDDESGPINGWQRVTSLLSNMIYLKDMVESPIDNDHNTMNYTIFTKQSGTGTAKNTTFIEAIQNLKENHRDYDFFFFDINLANSDEKFMGEAISEFPRKTVDKLNHGEKSAFIAGLEFINVLQKDDRPKIFFSGSTEARSFLRFIWYVQNRFDDVTFEDFDKGNEFIDKVMNKLNTYILQKQLQICVNLNQSQISDITSLLHKKEFDTPCIPCIDDKSQQWSLRTLFPRQCNLIENYEQCEAVNEKEREEYEKTVDDLTNEIKNITINFPTLFQDICNNGSHIKDHKDASGKTKDEQVAHFSSILRSLKDKEFKKDGFKKGVSFTPIENLILSIDEGMIKSLRNDIQNHGWPYIQSYLGHDSEPFRKWMSQYGLYPGYVDYILGILDNNIRSRGQVVLQAKVTSVDGHFELSVTSESSRPVETIHLNGFQKKGIGTPNDNFFYGECSEGIQDIIKIICFRYRGKYQVISGLATISFEVKDNCLMAEYSSGDLSFTDRQIEQKVIINSLKVFE
ncbi:MAG: hypothetical protein WDO16_12225 [Bacteroidota bacterium]